MAVDATTTMQATAAGRFVESRLTIGFGVASISDCRPTLLTVMPKFEFIFLRIVRCSVLNEPPLPLTDPRDAVNAVAHVRSRKS